MTVKPTLIRRFTTIAFAAWAIAILPQAVQAAPTLGNLSLHGLQAGATTTIAIDGADLAPNPRIVLPIAIAKQVVKQGANAQRFEVELTLDAATPPGIYSLRVATDQGISNAMPIGIDALPQQPWAPQIAKLPVALHGNLSGAAILKTKLTGKKDQPIVIDVEARRLGAAINPTVRLVDGRGVQLAYSPPMPTLGDDCRLQTVLPADGEYTIELHDVLYRAGSPGHFRLKVGTLHFADLAYPLGAQRGAKTSLEFVSSNLPADQRVEVEFSGLGSTAAPWPKVDNLTGPRPRVVVSDHPQVVEQAVKSPALQTLPAVPVAINGRLAAEKEEDRFLMPVTPGAKLRLDVLADRAGSPLDAVLMVRDEAGNQLAAADDRPNSSDPQLDYTVSANVKAIVVAVKDLHGRGGRDYVYQVAVTPLDRPDFNLVLADDAYTVPQGGRAVIRIEVQRAGYNGPIKLEVTGLPSGVTVAGDVVPADANIAMLSLASSEGAPNAALCTIVGHSADPAVKLSRTATLSGRPVLKFQPDARRELAMAVTGAGAIRVDWDSISSTDRLPLAGKFAARVKVARANDVKGPVRLSLLTSQVMPKKNASKDDQRQVDDIARALRIDGVPTIAADQANGAASVVVPPDLPRIEYQLVIRADLLNPEGNRVVASSFTLPRTLATEAPPATQTLAVFEDDESFISALSEGDGVASLAADDKYAGKASAKITPGQRFNAALPGLGVKIREKPAAGEYRYLRFAWKKRAGAQICLQINHDGQWGPTGGKPGKFRYHSGAGPEVFGASVAVDEKLPNEWTVVTRDLFADFGEFTFTGLALTALDGEYALFDHIHLGRSVVDFESVKPK